MERHGGQDSFGQTTYEVIVVDKVADSVHCGGDMRTVKHDSQVFCLHKRLDMGAFTETENIGCQFQGGECDDSRVPFCMY